jgi:hypothetical protein
MEKKSKVKSVQANGTWTGQGGTTYYKFEVCMENGDIGEYSSKKQEQDKFVIGEEVAYNYTGGQYPKIKPIYDKPKNDDNRQLLIARQSSLKVAAEIAIASGDIEQLLPMAERLTNWVLTGEK